MVTKFALLSDFVISLCVIFALFLLWILFFPQYRPCLFRSRLLPNRKPPSPEEEQRTNNNNISDADQEEDKELLSWIHQRSRDRFGVQAQPQAPPAPPATLTKQPPLRGQPKPVKMGLGLGFIAPPQAFRRGATVLPHPTHCNQIPAPDIHFCRLCHTAASDSMDAPEAPFN